MSLKDKLLEIIKSEESGDDEKKLKEQLEKLEAENKKLKEEKKDPHQEIKDRIAALTKENEELEKKGKSTEVSSTSKTESEESEQKDKGSAFPPPNSKGVITQEMIKDLPDTPENREFLIKNIDTVSRAMSG